MNRRDVLKAGVAAGALGLAPRLARPRSISRRRPRAGAPSSLTTKVEPILRHQGVDPAADLRRRRLATARRHQLDRQRQARRADAAIPSTAPRCCEVEWAADQQNPVIEVTTQVRAQNRSVRPGQGSVAPLSDDERKFNLMATALLPVDGLVKETAEGIVRGKTERRRQGARALRMGGREHLPQRQDAGCGVGDVSWMIKTGNLNGKCADLNALFVAMCPLGRRAGARRLRHPRRAVGVRLQVAGRRQHQRHQGAALPRRGLARRQRLDAGRSGRRAQGRARGAADQPSR